MKSISFVVFIVLFSASIAHSSIIVKGHLESENEEAIERVKRFAHDHPCSSHLEITNPDRRVSKKLETGDQAISDHYLQSGWYRFKGPAGGLMPTNSPVEKSCGTKWPIWLKGSHPEEEGGVSMGSACMVHQGQECFRQWELQVANCGSYYIYRLNNPPMYESSYCAGMESLCPEGSNSHNGYTPDCTANFPSLTGRVKLRVSHREDSMEWDCDYQGRVPGDTKLEVLWFIEGDKDTNPYTPVWVDMMVERKRSQLTRGRWKNKLGSTVYCKVRALWRNGQGVPSRAIVSKKHFAGIKLMNETVTVSEALEAGEIEIQSTVPVVCMPEYESLCKIVVELEYDADNEEHQQVVFGDCSVHITPDNWNQVHKIRVKAVRDFYDDGRKERIIRFKKIYTTVASDIWNGYQIPDIKVFSSNGKTGLCTSHGDPHMLTFDRLLYHAYQEGEYVLFESTKFPIKINARMQKCATATCNCAVAVAVQDDIIVVDRCTRTPRNHASGASFPNGWNTIHAHVIEQGGNFAKGLNVYEHDDGRKYTIHLPTGAYVQFELMEQWVNIYIHASSDDFNSTKGLCGTFDGVNSNDFLLSDGSYRSPVNGESCGPHVDTCDFLNSWKVAEEDSLFKDKVDLRWGDSQILREESFCLCKEINGLDTITCDYQNDIYNSEARYEQQHGKLVTEEVKIHDRSTKSFANRRRKRSVDEIHDDPHVNDFADDYFNSNFVHNDSFRGELRELKPRREAEILCSAAFNSAYLSSYVYQLERQELDQLLETCTIDVQMTNSEEWIEMSVKQIIAKATSKMIKKQLDSSLMVDVCPQACSNHGRCVDRICQCHAGWGGSYCAIDLSTAPSILRLANAGLCDNEESQCDNIKVYGKKFKSADNVTCLIKQMASTSDESVVGEHEVRAKFINFELILVPLPLTLKDMQVFDVAFIINGHLTSSSRYIVHSSKCQSCSVQESGVSCSKKEDTCYIDHMCYAPDESSQEDCCSVCQPSLSTLQFTSRAWPPSTHMSNSIHLEMHDSIAFFNPPIPFACSNHIQITGNNECREDIDSYLRGEEGNEIVFASKVDRQINCVVDVKVKDGCSDVEMIFHVNLTSDAKVHRPEDACKNKPANRDTVQYWDVHPGTLETRQIQSHHSLTPSPTYKIQLPRGIEDTVEYISISEDGLISYNVPEYEQMLSSITVTLTHTCANVERFEIRFFDELE